MTPSIRAADRMSIAVVVGVMLASLTLLPLTVDHGFLRYSWIIVLLLGVASAFLRRLHLQSGVVVAIQTIVAVGALLVVADLLPRAYAGESYWHSLRSLYLLAAHHMQVQSAPMEPNSGVTFLLVSVVCLIAIITDLMAIALRRAAWTLAPLVTLYLVPALGLSDKVSWVYFVLIAVGYLSILLVEGMNTTGRWTRGLTHDSARGIGNAEPVVLRAAALIGVPALVLALVAGAVLPTVNLSGLGGGNGPGNGGPLQLTDPTTDLQRNLNLPEERVVLTYTTSNPNGEYLRMASLPKFDNHGWQNASISVHSGKLSRPPGLTEKVGPEVTSTIHVGDFGSEYLPAPYAPTSFAAAGHWGYDPDSLVILSTDRNSSDAIRNLTYTVKSIDVSPTLGQLEKAKAGRPPDDKLTADVPKDLPQSLRDLTKQVIKGAKTPADKAAAIQAYLRSPVFTYSTQQLPGSGYQALVNFLLVDHKGYCVQFAAAMAMMARVAGIPSRFAVGTLPGTKVGDHWEVTNHQVHAWPELYFTGLGWVRYDPTPSVGTAPPWSIITSASGTDGATQQPTTAATSPTQGSASQQPSTAPTHQPVGTTVGASSHVWEIVAIVVGALVLLGLALITPMLARRRLRRRRLAIRVRPGAARDPGGGEPGNGASGADGLAGPGLGSDRRGARAPAEQVEAAWAELRDTKVDLRSNWPTGSPRTIARTVGADLSPEDAQALHRLAILVERGRYARRFDDPAAVAGVAGDVRRLRTALLEPHPWRRRVLATMAPKSLWVNLRRPTHHG